MQFETVVWDKLFSFFMKRLFHPSRGSFGKASPSFCTKKICKSIHHNIKESDRLPIFSADDTQHDGWDYCMSFLCHLKCHNMYSAIFARAARSAKKDTNLNIIHSSFASVRSSVNRLYVSEFRQKPQSRTEQNSRSQLLGSSCCDSDSSMMVFSSTRRRTSSINFVKVINFSSVVLHQSFQQT